MDWYDRYEILRGSDVDADGMYLEARDRSDGEIVSFAFHSDVDGSMTFDPPREGLPAAFLAWFQAEAWLRLTPASEPEP